MLEKSFIVISLFVSFTMVIAIVLTKLETRKIKCSMDIYVKITRLTFQYKKSYQSLEGYKYLKDKMQQFIYISENYNSFPYKDMTVKETKILSNVDKIEKMIDERILASKNGLPDLYREIGEINKEIYMVYNPVKYFKSEIKFNILFVIIRFLVPILIPVLKNIDKSKTKPKDLTNLRSNELLSANVKLKLN